MLAMFLARRHATASYSEVGRHFGGRNHSTAVAAEKKVRQWLRDGTLLTAGEGKRTAAELLQAVERELAR